MLRRGGIRTVRHHVHPEQGGHRDNDLRVMQSSTVEEAEADALRHRTDESNSGLADLRQRRELHGFTVGMAFSCA